MEIFFCSEINGFRIHLLLMPHFIMYPNESFDFHVISGISLTDKFQALHFDFSKSYLFRTFKVKKLK